MADDKQSTTFTEIEETQDALRECIERSKHLTEKTQQLLERHRQELDEGAAD